MTSKRQTIMGTRHAVDAGVTAGLAIGVLQTEKVNIGGVAPQIIYTAKDRKVHSTDGLGVWPRAVTPDYLQKKHGGADPRRPAYVLGW